MSGPGNPWKISRIVLIVAGEYAVFAVLFTVLLQFYSPTPAQVASAGAVFFGVVSLLNFIVAGRLAGDLPPLSAAHHLKLLREEFLYLRWYFDEILETMSSGILVLDRVLTVRSMNHAQRHLLCLKEKEELIGKPFRHHPLSKELYEGEIYGHRGHPLIDVLESCVRDGESILLEEIHFNQENGEEPKPLNILIYPWKNRKDETDRLVIRMDDKSIPAETRGQMDIERLLAGTSPDSNLPTPFSDSIGFSIAGDCETIRDHLEALLASSRSIHELLEPAIDGPQAEMLLFEMQVQKIIDMIRQMQRDLSKGSL